MSDPAGVVGDPKPADSSEGGENWLEGVPEEVRSSPHLAHISSVSSLAQSYVQASEQLSKSHPGPAKDEAWDSFAQKTQKFFHIPDQKDEYKHAYEGEYSKEVSEIAYKYRLHPMQVKPVVEDLLKVFNTGSEGKTAQRVEIWAKDSEKVFEGVEGKDEILGRALKKMGVTREALEAEFGGFMKHPLLNKVLLALGKDEGSVSSEPITSKTTKKDIGIKEKFDELKIHMNDRKSPYWNSEHPDHFNMKRKIDGYARDVSRYQQQNPQSEASNWKI